MRRPNKIVKAMLIATVLVVGLCSASKATYLTGKAWVAQILLHRTWEQSVEDEQPRKPWPWADIETVAKLQIPRLNKEQIVLATHSGEAMAFGPGLIQRDNSYILAGHRDSHFAFLRHLQLGDEIILNLQNGDIWTATVNDIQIFDINEHPSLIAPENSISLVTCYPFDAIQTGGSLRYLVTAHKKSRACCARLTLSRDRGLINY